MCKVLIIAGIKDQHRENAIKFTKTMADIISTGNSDGLGYAMVDEAGVLSAERWLVNKDAFRTAGPYPPDLKLSKAFNKAIKNGNIETVYNKYGNPDMNKMTAVTLHARLATSGKGMANVHPFIYDKFDTSLIHNGVIHNDSEFDLVVSTCDSEAILISYLYNAVNLEIPAAAGMAEDLRGYYACGVFSRDAQRKRTLDVFKANNDNLYLTHVAELGTWVMSSLEYDIKTCCEKLGFKHGTIFPLNDGFLLRFDPNTGDIVDSGEFKVSERYFSTYNNNYNSHRGASQYNARTGKTEPLNTTSEAGTNVCKLPLPKNKNITEEEIEYMKLTPSISKLGDQETLEIVRAYSEHGG